MSVCLCSAVHGPSVEGFSFRLLHTDAGDFPHQINTIGAALINISGHVSRMTHELDSYARSQEDPFGAPPTFHLKPSAGQI